MKKLLLGLKEPVKSLLILLLLCSALFLAWQTGLFSGLLPQSEAEGDGSTGSGEGTLSYTRAAWPCAAAITWDNGLRYGVKYDDAAMEQIYSQLSVPLGETLGSSEAPVRISEKSWTGALSRGSVFLDYESAQSLPVLALWLGTEAEALAGSNARRLLLAPGEAELTQLLFQDAAGRFFRCATMATWSSVQTAVSAFLPNGASFARELEGLEACEPYSLILEQLPALTLLQSYPGALDSCANRAAQVFSVPMNSGSSYPEPDGTQVYLGEYGSLRRSPEGLLSYRYEEGAPVCKTEALQIEQSRQLLEQLHEAFRREEQLFYVGSWEQGDMTTVYFDYRAGSLPVHLESGHAAWCQFREGVLQEVGIYPRSYGRSAEHTDLLPEMQAAAAAGSIRAGSEARLVYPDLGGESLNPVWSVRG